MKPIAILGCGPSGLLAAHAVGMYSGKPIAIFSKAPTKSRLGGAQFLHSDIPGLTDEDPEATITYRVRGNAETYREKVYGEMHPSFVSFSNLIDGKTQPAWNLIRMYDRLWDSLGGSINDADIDDDWFAKTANDFDGIVSSIPLPALCRTPEAHRFQSVKTKILGECLEDVPANTIVYDGSPLRSWSRSSNLFGHEGTEWGAHVTPPFPNLSVASKPVSNRCDCRPDVLKVGRFGTWTKGVLVNDAFQMAADWVAEGMPHG